MTSQVNAVIPQDFKQPHRLSFLPQAGQEEGQVPGREADPVAWRKDRRLTAVAVGLILFPTYGPLETSVRRFTGLLSVLKPLVHSRGLGLARMPRCQGRLIPQHALEQSEVSGGVAERILHVLSPR